MSAQPEQAAKEILGGEPAAAARRWLGPTALVMFVLFAIDTVLVINGFWLPIDIRVATFVQGVNWGPLAYVLQVINVTAGYWQVLGGIIPNGALFIVERRGGVGGRLGGLLQPFYTTLQPPGSPPPPTGHLPPNLPPP